MPAGAFFERHPECAGDTSLSGVGYTCFFQQDTVAGPGSLSTSGADVFQGFGFEVSALSAYRLASTYAYGTIRASGTATSHVDAPPVPDETTPFYVGVSDAAAGATIIAYDWITAFDSSLPDGAPLALRFTIPISGRGTNATSGRGEVSSSFSIFTEWMFDAFAGHAASGAITGAAAGYADTITASFVVPNNDAFFVQWLFGAVASTRVYEDTDHPFGAGDAEGSVDASASLFFDADSAGVRFTSASGHDYRSAVAAVAEPDVLLLFVAAAAGAVAARQRHGPSFKRARAW